MVQDLNMEMAWNFPAMGDFYIMRELEMVVKEISEFVVRIFITG